jgi:hypothetical protein
MLAHSRLNNLAGVKPASKNEAGEPLPATATTRIQTTRTTHAADATVLPATVTPMTAVAVVAA